MPCLCFLAFLGIHFSCVPSPVRLAAGSRKQPSTDHVFQNVFSGFGSLARCVSRSATWMPLTSSFFMSFAQPSRSLVFRLHEFQFCVFGDVEQSLFDKPGHHARIGAASSERQWCRRGCGFSASMVSAAHSLCARRLRLCHRSKIRPRPDDSIDIQTPSSRQSLMMSIEDVSTERLMQKPWPSPLVSSGVRILR